ncbi:hypothetical protein PYW08_011172 [Mythimna loreyi]|uniref:Uncharacterized protein n=1 Tax=Mythimna loreyi TaxID=667449 RepID=A0ACC2Q7M0_9NEOP|nr:hypothetical protein PYW08_011172 [Mythimna loreyi]
MSTCDFSFRIIKINTTICQNCFGWRLARGTFLCIIYNPLISNMTPQEGERKKLFTTLEKDLFLNIIQKYDSILNSKQTNTSNVLRKKQSWEKIALEFNESSVVTQKATTKQLIKLWYNMKAKAKESKTKENISGGPTGVLSDSSDETWYKKDEDTISVSQEKIEVEFKTPVKRNFENLKTKMDVLKCKLLEEELEFKKKMHEEELKIKILEREHKQNLFQIELEIKLKELEKYDVIE